MIIANGDSEAEEVATAGADLVGIVMPAGWDAAKISFLGSRVEADTPVDVYNANSEVAIDGVGTNRYIVVNPATVRGIPFLTLRSGVTALAVTQTAERTLKLIFRRFT